MCGELVHSVELRHRLKNLDESLPRVALIGDEEQPRVILQALPPWRPAFGDEVRAVVISIPTPQDLCAAVQLDGAQPQMRGVWNYWIAIAIDRGEIRRVEFSLPAQRGARIFPPAD